MTKTQTTQKDKSSKKEKKKMTISEILKGNAAKNTIPPVLLSFKHAACNPDAIAGSNETELDMEVKSWKASKPNLEINLKTSHLTYTNSDVGENPYYKTYIAIREKSTGKTRLIETVSAVLKPEVVYPKSTNPILLANDTEHDKASYWESRKQLIKAFGQKSGQRYFENKEALKVDEEDTQARIRRAAGNVSVESLDTLQSKVKEETFQLIPERDENAGRADLIYRLEHLLSEREVNDLKEVCVGILDQYNSPQALDTAVDKKVFSRIGGFFLKNLLKMSGTDEMDARYAALTIYLDSIIKFSKLRPLDLAKGFNSLPKYLPVIMKKKIFDLFSTGVDKKRIVSPELKDRASCYVIVISLMLNNCKIDVSFITESIRVDPRNLKKLVRVTGANLESDSSTNQQKIVLRKTLATYDINYTPKPKQKRK